LAKCRTHAADPIIAPVGFAGWLAHRRIDAVQQTQGGSTT
jgi:hypothetical protein